MIKLSDIFNINLNTGDGNKLFARIMNKYNVPKQEYKNIRKGLKEQSVSSSSDMEYYKVDSLSTIEYVALYKIKLGNGNIVIQGIAEERSEYTKAIAYAPMAYNGVIYNNFKDLVIARLEGMTEEEIEYMLSMFTPITKEEFYDLNNI